MMRELSQVSRLLGRRLHFLRSFAKHATDSVHEGRQERPCYSCSSIFSIETNNNEDKNLSTIINRSKLKLALLPQENWFFYQFIPYQSMTPGCHRCHRSGWRSSISLCFICIISLHRDQLPRRGPSEYGHQLKLNHRGPISLWKNAFVPKNCLERNLGIKKCFFFTQKVPFSWTNQFEFARKKSIQPSLWRLMMAPKPRDHLQSFILDFLLPPILHEYTTVKKMAGRQASKPNNPHRSC